MIDWLLIALLPFLMARIKVTPNFSLEKIVKDELLPTEAEVRRAAVQLAVDIEKQNAQGFDENNRRFAPCADSTPKSGTVTLHETSRMFADFGPIKVTRRGFALGFRTTRSEDLAHFHETGAGNLPVRKFLGVPASWIDGIVTRLWKKR